MKEDESVNIFWEGPFKEGNCLASYSRELISNLRSESLQVGITSPFIEENNEASMDSLDDPFLSLLSEVKFDRVDFTISFLPILNFQHSPKEIYIPVISWPYGSIPIHWAEEINTKVDRVWVFSKHMMDVLTREGVRKNRVTLIPVGVDTELYNPGNRPLELKTEKSYKFLYFDDLTTSKGIDILISAYEAEFTEDEDVCLVVQSFSPDKLFSNKVREINKIKGAAEILYLKGIKSYDEPPRLFTTCDCYVQPYRAEQLGVSILRAMASGLPVIATNSPLCSEFCNLGNSLPLATRRISLPLKRWGDYVTNNYPILSEPSLPELRRLLRYAFENRDKGLELGQKARQTVEHNHKLERTVSVIRGELSNLLVKREPRSFSSQRPRVKISFSGPLLEMGGKGERSRDLYRKLDKKGIETQAFISSPREAVNLDPDLSQRLREKHYSGPIDLFITHSFFEDGFIGFVKSKNLNPGGYHIGITALEGGNLPLNLLQRIQRMDEIWVPSNFNKQVLMDRGVQSKKVKVFPIGIDIKRFDPESAQALKIVPEGLFSFLSIFRWSKTKGWDILTKAFLEEFSPEENVCLVINSFSNQYLNIKGEINRFISRLGYNPKRTPQIIVLPQLPAHQIPFLYNSCDAFVLPSRGETFGQALGEAMAMELPTIGTKWGGNLDFMNQENSYLIEIEVPTSITNKKPKFIEPSISHLKSIMREVFQDWDRAKLKGIAARQEIIKAWSTEKCTKKIAARLQKIANRLNVSRITLGRVEKLRVAWEGSLFVYHSLALVNRELCLRLLARDNVELSIIPYEPDQFGPEDDPRFPQLAARVRAPLSRPADVHIRHQWPPNFTPPPEGHWVMIQPWEYGAIPEEWIKPINLMVDELWVYSKFVKDCYIQSGVDPGKIFVIPNGVNFDLFNPQEPPLKLRTKKKFKFLFVGGTIWRKGIDLLLQAYRQSFTAQDDVCLVIKDMGQDSFYRGQGAGKLIKEMQMDKDAPEVLYLKATIPEGKMAGLYTACDCLVHPYRGEGFGLPVAEGLACGLPAILTKGGACDEFCPSDDIYWVPSQRREIKIKLKTAGKPWVLEPSPEVLGQRLKEVYAHREAAKKKGLKLAEKIRKTLGWEKSVELVLGRIAALRGKPVLRKEGRQKMSVIKERKAMEYMKMGDQHREGGENELAERFYRKSLDNAPENQEILEKLGALLFEGNRFKEAIPLYEKLTEIDPWSADNFRTLGECLFKDEKVSEAKSVLERALELNPTAPQIETDLGVVLWQEGNLEGALEHLQEALKMAPQNPETMLNLALICYQVGLYEEAAGLLERYSGLETPGADVRLCLGDCYFNLERRDLAKREFELALFLDPELKEAEERLKELQV